MCAARRAWWICRSTARGAARVVDLQIHGAQRIALVGANGSGKSTLLKVLAGRLAPLAGRCDVPVETAYLDQRLSTLDAEASIVTQLLAADPASEASALRTRLALLGLDAQRVT
ncbi:MAG: ATP-binding cassette domain-containing protein, partial [Solimonas sp.]